MKNDNYNALCDMLRVAIALEERQDEYVRMLIDDAKLVRESSEMIYSIHQQTYQYATILGRSGENFIDNIDTQNLSFDDYDALLDFFERL